MYFYRFDFRILKKTLLSLSLFLFSLSCTWAQKTAFIENVGQWDSPFEFNLPFPSGGIYISSNELVYTFRKYAEIDLDEDHENHDVHGPNIPIGTPIYGHSYKVKFLGANVKPQIKPSKKRKAYLNYLLGNDPEKWRSNVGMYEQLTVVNLYPGIDLKYYFNKEANLKYDLILDAGVNSDLIQIEYQGADGLELSHGNLVVKNSVQDVVELKPFAYQWINGEKVEVKCKYIVEGNLLKFKIGRYDSDKKLIIDPVLIFSTYSASKADNFGFTATYGEGGMAYGGGIVFSGGKYPTTLGAYQDTFGGGTVDVGISKYSSDGSDLIFSTYIGGTNNEVPLSIIEGANKELLILGTTGSPNFPTTLNAYDRTFDTSAAPPTVSGSILYSLGSDMFVCKLDSTGGVLKASTYFGGDRWDGLNWKFGGNNGYNYGDDNRGDIAVDSLGNIYAVSSTNSSDLPNNGGHVPTPNFTGQPIDQDGIIFSFNSTLSTLNWSTYLSGSDDDALFSLKHIKGNLYASGMSSSADLGAIYTGGFQSQLAGAQDGFIIKVDPSNGAVSNFTYNGTVQRDGNYLMDVDDWGNVYVFGQSRGSYPTLGEGVFSQPDGGMFLNQFNSDLSTSLKSMTFGDNVAGPSDISPTALMVDVCGNMYISGWGDRIRSVGTQTLPVTNQLGNVTGARYVSDGRDFYFMVLDASWKKVNFAAFFGVYNPGVNGSGDHVDGGTSRFQKDGTIYQAVCAGCGGLNTFPTSDSAYSRINEASNCNMAVVKLRMEIEVTTDFQVDIDSTCIPYTVSLLNRSYNADIYQITDPDGNIFQGEPTQIVVDKLGYQTYKIVASDTICGFVDSIDIVLYGYLDDLIADFETDNDTCNGSLLVNFKNKTINSDSYFWDFGDGAISFDQNPSHEFATDGSYEIQFIVSGGNCGNSDTLIKIVQVKNASADGSFAVGYDPCSDGTIAKFYAGASGFEYFRWTINGQEVGDSTILEYDFGNPGTYQVELTSIDSSCSKFFTSLQTINIGNGRINVFMPNLFTPNDDGQNDVLKLIGEFAEDDFSEFTLKMYNRWGSELWSSATTEGSWDGTFENADVPQGVYYYVIQYADKCGNSSEINGFVHLFR